MIAERRIKRNLVFFSAILCFFLFPIYLDVLTMFNHKYIIAIKTMKIRMDGNSNMKNLKASIPAALVVFNGSNRYIALTKQFKKIMTMNINLVTYKGIPFNNINTLTN